MKKALLVITILLVAMFCVSFAGNVVADDHAAVATEEMASDQAADEADQAQVAVDDEESAEAYSEPEAEEAGMTDEEPTDE